MVVRRSCSHIDRSDPTVWCRVDLSPCNCRSADHPATSPVRESDISCLFTSITSSREGGRESPLGRAASNTESLGDSRGSEWGPAALLALCPITTDWPLARSICNRATEGLNVRPFPFVPRSILRRARPQASLTCLSECLPESLPSRLREDHVCSFSPPSRAWP